MSEFRRVMREKASETAMLREEQEQAANAELLRQRQLDATFRGIVTDQELKSYLEARDGVVALTTHVEYTLLWWVREKTPTLSITAEGVVRRTLIDDFSLVYPEMDFRLCAVEGDVAIAPDGERIELNPEDVEKYSHVIDPNDQTAFMTTEQTRTYSPKPAGTFLAEFYDTWFSGWTAEDIDKLLAEGLKEK